MSTRLSACISAIPTGRIFVKFDIVDFYENLSKTSKFGYDRAKLLGTLHEDVSTFCLLSATLNRHKSAVFSQHGIRLLR
jgi:hypothetical protein